MLTITIPGAPVGKQRARATRGGRMYTPAKTANTEAFVKLCAMQALPEKYEIAVEPLFVAVEAICDVPASWSKKKRETALSGVSRPTGKPDLDNIAKLYCDALNGIVWKDDAQIVNMQLTKRYGHEPKTIITVRQA
jgi:Holliday junction resolvase RusA-like endonuclease